MSTTKTTSRKPAAKATTKVVTRPEAKAATAKAPAAKATTTKAPAARKTTKTVEAAPAEDLSKLSKGELMARAKQEREAVKAAKAAGTEVPATPAIDAMKAITPEAWKGSKGKATNGERKPRESALTPEAAARVEAILREEAAAGNRWHQAAKRLNDEGVKTAKGGAKWYYSTITVHAKRLGLI